MQKKFLFLVTAGLLLAGSNIFGQAVNQVRDISPTLENYKLTYPLQEAMWDIQLEFDATAASGAAGNAGSETDGTFLYTTRWASNLLHQYDLSGNLIQQFSIPGVTGLRDLAYDGTYFYGGNAGFTIYQMDFNTMTLVGTIPSPVAVRHIAYDEANDAFWVGNWADSPTLVDRSGIILNTIVTGFAAQYGTAYDAMSPGGPFLWVFDQGGGAGTPQYIHQFDIASGTATGVTHDVMTDVGVGNTSGIAGGLFTVDGYVSGFYSLGGLLQGVPDEFFIYELVPSGPPVGPGPATDPIPANGATGVSILISDLMWTNPPGATENEVYFGTNPGSLTLIHSGSLVSSVPVPGPLVYNTTYYWRVNEIDGSGTTTGSLWSFTTEQDPNLVIILEDHFDTFDWTPVGPMGLTNWSTQPSANAGGTAPELQFSWTPSFNGASYLLSPMLTGYGGNEIFYSFTHFLDWFSDPCGPVGLAYTTDGGSTYTTLWEITPTGNVGPELLEGSFIAPGDFQFALYYNGDSFNIDFWFIDDFIAYYIIPVELTSFTANVNETDVTLNWSTATETNNQGFDIERKSSNGQYEKIGYVAGHGTVSETQNYSYTDKNLTPGTYTYRLKQIDFDGQFEYSDEVEVEVVSPKVYELSQNYPNPFNPSTTISFSLAADSKVTLTVFDVLGQKVAELVNGQLTSGTHTVNFDASNLNSGVYFYRIDAAGVDGTNYSSVKKMSLMK